MLLSSHNYFILCGRVERRNLATQPKLVSLLLPDK